MKRRVRVVLLCEDPQHEAFGRRFLDGMGWNTREIRVEQSPGGSAEQWVRQRFPIELREYRKRQAASALIAIIDADVKSVQDRIAEFEIQCKSIQIPFRKPDEAVAIVIPKRNIETWIHHLNGVKVNENDNYPKLQRERECKPAVKRLIGMCKSGGICPDGLPPSLATACEEYGRIRNASQV